MLDADVSISVPRPAPGTATSFARMSHAEGDTGDTSTTPRKRLRAQSHNTSEEDASDTEVVPQGKVSDPKRLVIRIPPLRYLAHLFRNNPARTKSLWRVVELPKSRACPTQRFAAPSSRPRVWAGVRHSPISMHVLLLILSAAEQRRAVGCVPCSCEKRERCRRGASRISYSYLLWGRTRLSARLVGRGRLGEPQDRFLNVGPISVDGHFISPSPLLLLSRTLLTLYLSYSIRETKAPLMESPKRPSVFIAHDPTPDGGLIVADAQPENPSNPLFDDNGAHMIPRSVPLYPGSSAPPSGQMDPDHPLIGIEYPTGAAPFQPTSPVSSYGLNRSHPTLEPELRHDHDVCINAARHLAAPSMPCGADATPDGCPPNDCPSAEATHIDGLPSFDPPISIVHSHGNGSAGGVPAFDTECGDSSEARGAELSHSVPPSTREHPVEHSPQAVPALSSPSKSAHPNTIFPLRTAATATSFSYPSEKSLPGPPPEVVALLSAQSSGKVVSPVVARDSPLVPWELPSEIGYFWLGLFRISVVKVIFMSVILSEKRFQFITSRLWLGRNASASHIEGPHNSSTYLAFFPGMGARRRGLSQGRVHTFHDAVVGTGASPAFRPAPFVQAL